MKRVRRNVRDFVLWAVLTGGLVALVLGQAVIGAILVAFAVWQFILIGAGRGGLFVDQRAADKPGKPTVSK